MISCIKFINVIVHSTEDRNQRVALQYEFTVLGLHEFLEVVFLNIFLGKYYVKKLKKI